MIHQTNSIHRPTRGTQQGFSLMEVMVSILVLSVGMISLLAVFGIAIASTQASQQDMIAKQLASEAMENIFTARNTDQNDPALGRSIQWGDLQNKPNGIFVTGPQPIKESGLDGIIGTGDDDTPRMLAVADPDGVIRDKTIALTGYTREIQLGDVAGTGAVRSITIIIRYTTPKSPLPKAYILNGYISQYR